MEPALHDGYILTLRTDPLALRRLKHGDVVVLRHPWRPSLKLVKRIAGVPGDYLTADGRPAAPDAEVAGWRLGDREYFVISDNRAAGLDDSRRFGPVPHRLIEGRLMIGDR